MLDDPRTSELTDSDFVTMMTAIHTCVLIHDADTKDILWANPAACDLLEFSLNEIRPLKANHMSSSAQQYDRVVGRAWLQEAVDQGVSRIEWHYRSRSGRVIPTDALAIRVELARGPAVMVQFRDIEREQQIERDLRLTTSYVDALAHYTSTLALMLDESGRIRFATDTALAAVGADVHGPMVELQSLARLLSGGRTVDWNELRGLASPVVSVELEVAGENAETAWLEGSLERLRVKGADALLMILHDVSGRVLDQLRRDREQHHQNYLARYNAMGDMAMTIAHELGQPLAAARNFIAGVLPRIEQLSLVPAGSSSVIREVAHGLESIEVQIDRASSIVQAVRAYVGHLEQVEQVVDLNDVVEECRYFLDLRGSEMGVDIVVRLSPTPVHVAGERVLTGQVVMNLCLNAIDESVAAGAPAIELSTRPDGTFAVADRGRGIQRDPFAESFTSKQDGAGIGLALSYRIVTRQHGRIWAEARNGGGSVFGFQLPMEPSPLAGTS